MDLKNHLMKSTTVSINRDLNETWINFYWRGFRTNEHSTCKHRWHSAKPIWQSGFIFRMLHFWIPAERFSWRVKTPNIRTRNISSGRCDQSVVEIYHGKIGIPLSGQRCSEISFHSCKCFDLPGNHSGYGLCKLWIQMSFLFLVCKSCQPQQPSRSTIPLRFSPIWLRDAERFELVLPEHLSQWGINGCTDFEETWITESKFKHG